MQNFLLLLGRAGADVALSRDPDGVAPRQALLLVLYAGLNAPPGPHWARFTPIVAEADRELQAGLRDPVALIAANVPPIDPAGDGPLRADVRSLTRQLGEFYAEATAGAPWRRIVWAKVAELLGDAADELD